MPLTDLQQIQQLFLEKEAENTAFQEYLKSLHVDELDELINALNKQIEPQIDCTSCGNCCKTLLINVNDEHADNSAAYLQLNREEFDKKFLEKGISGMMLINKIPCHFLHEDKCTIYEHRFESCREFPGLHLPKFKERLFTVFMHYDRCPIVFNVMEELKSALHFVA